MTTLVAHLDDIQHRLDALARQHHVPGAVLAVRKGDEALDFATGVINSRTGVGTTTDAVFQIGSNTKLLTTTLVMQLADTGDVDLDEPVRRYVPAFELAERGAAGKITLRHLLTHASGIQGDYFEGFGRGDDAIERYVSSLKKIDLIHRPGQMWSYCNSGFVLAGHVVERVTGLPYHQALRERICEPPVLAARPSWSRRCWLAAAQSATLWGRTGRRKYRRLSSWRRLASRRAAGRWPRRRSWPVSCACTWPAAQPGTAPGSSPRRASAR